MKYTTSHEWIDLAEGEQEIYIIGITDHAQQELSDVVHVELPAVGKRVTAGEVMLSIDSVKAASDIYAPITGEIIAINEELQDNPALVNTAAESTGWLVKLKSADANLSEFLSKEQYAALVAEKA